MRSEYYRPMDYLQAIVTIIGSGVGTAIVGVAFKHSFDRKLEVQRAFLYRASRVHEKQLDTLGKLHGHLTEIRAYLQLLQKGNVIEGEKVDEYPALLAKSLVAAREQLTFGRLLIPQVIATACDTFFAKVYESQQEFAFSRWEMIEDVQDRIRLRDKATYLSYDVIPALLEQIDRAARQVIHGDNPAAK